MPDTGCVINLKTHLEDYLLVRRRHNGFFCKRKIRNSHRSWLRYISIIDWGIYSLLTRTGINFSFAKLLLVNGCNVLIADLALRPEAQAIVDKYSAKTDSSPRAMFQKTDVTDWPQLEEMFNVAVKEFGEIDIVCPGAGVYEPVCTSHCSWIPFTIINTDRSSLRPTALEQFLATSWKPRKSRLSVRFQIRPARYQFNPSHPDHTACHLSFSPTQDK